LVLVVPVAVQVTQTEWLVRILCLTELPLKAVVLGRELLLTMGALVVLVVVHLRVQGQAVQLAREQVEQLKVIRAVMVAVMVLLVAVAHPLLAVMGA
jgi:hypothetical protein